MAIPILLGAMAQASGFVGKGVLKGGIKTTGAAAGGVFSGAKFIASLPKKILGTILNGPTKILGFLGKIIGKPLGLLGISTSISSLLRQSQIFTGSIGALLQMVGAFIDIMLAPFMPYFASLMEKMGDWIPKIQEFSVKLHDFLVGDVWTWLKKQPKLMVDRFFGDSTWKDLTEWFSGQDWKEWINNPGKMLQGIDWANIAGKFSTAFQVLAKDISDAVKWVFARLQDVFLGKQETTWASSTIHDPNLEGGFGAMAKIKAGGLGPRSGGLWQQISEGFSNIDWKASTTSVMEAFGFSKSSIDTFFGHVDAIKGWVTAIGQQLGIEFAKPRVRDAQGNIATASQRYGIHATADQFVDARFQKTGGGALGVIDTAKDIYNKTQTAAGFLPIVGGVQTLRDIITEQEKYIQNINKVMKETAENNAYSSLNHGY